MKRALLLLSVLLSCSVAFAAGPRLGMPSVNYNEALILPQYVSAGFNTGILNLNPGWQFIQAWVTAQPCSGTSCNDDQIAPTTAGSVWIMELTGKSTSAVHISSISGGSGTWVHCTACQEYDASATYFQDAYYNLGGTTGTTNITLTMSGTPTTYGAVEFVELLPPPGYTASFDSGNGRSDTTCTNTCAAEAMTVTGSDAIWQSMGLQTDTPYGSINGWNSWVGGTGYNYETVLTGEGLCLNCTVGTAPNVTMVTSSGTGQLVMGLAFKSTAGSFHSPAPFYSLVNINAYLSGTQTAAFNCSPTCSYTLSSTTAGNLLFIQASDEVNADYISSISGGGTWVIPSGCQKTNSDGSNLTLSCGYVLSATGGTTSISITMSGSSSDVGFVVYEVHRASGTWTLDTIGATQNSASFLPSGQPLTLTGNLDVIFQGFANDGAVSQCNYGPLYFIGGTNGPAQFGNEFLWTNSTSFALINSYTDITPVCVNPQDNASIVHGVAFK